MPKYLIRRTNRFGQWEHIDTWESPPDRDSIAQRYGPGEYSIMVAEEGIRGLQSYASYTIPFSIEYVGWTPDKPDLEYIRSRYGEGNYFVIGRAIEVESYVVYTNGGKSDEMVQDLMTRGAQAMRSVYVIFRMTGLPYRSPI